MLEGWGQPGGLPREEREGVGEGVGSRGDGGGLLSESESVGSSLREGGPVDEEWRGVGVRDKLTIVAKTHRGLRYQVATTISGLGD